MGYTPQEQELDGPVQELQDSIKKAREVMLARLRSNEYIEQHIEKLTELVMDLTALEIKLIRLKQ